MPGGCRLFPRGFYSPEVAVNASIPFYLHSAYTIFHVSALRVFKHQEKKRRSACFVVTAFDAERYRGRLRLLMDGRKAFLPAYTRLVLDSILARMPG